MSTLFWLTDENADVQGYKRLKMEARSDCPSMVRVTSVAYGAVTMGMWISDPLDGVDLTAAAWQFHIWGMQSIPSTAALRFTVQRFTTSAGEDSTVVEAVGPLLSTQPRSSGGSTTATATTMADGDRIALTVYADVVSGTSAIVSYNGLRSRSEGDSYIVCPDNLALTAKYPEQTRTAIRQMIQDVSQTNPNLKDLSIDQALQQALRDYTRDKPCIESEFISGDGSTRLFSMPRRWIYGFSSMIEIEYPVREEGNLRLVMNDDSWEVLEGTLGMQPTRALRFISVIPEIGTDNVRLRYTTRHIHTDDENTIPPQDLDAVVCLGAAYCCIQLAAHAAASTAPTISADAVGARDTAQQWQSIAKDLRTRYVDRILGGGEDVPVGAASVTRDWDIEPSIPGTHYMFHHARMR